jgi:hypothetical protein
MTIGIEPLFFRVADLDSSHCDNQLLSTIVNFKNIYYFSDEFTKEISILVQRGHQRSATSPAIGC